MTRFEDAWALSHLQLPVHFQVNYFDVFQLASERHDGVLFLVDVFFQQLGGHFALRFHLHLQFQFSLHLNKNVTIWEINILL